MNGEINFMGKMNDDKKDGGAVAPEVLATSGVAGMQSPFLPPPAMPQRLRGPGSVPMRAGPQAVVGRRTIFKASGDEAAVRKMASQCGDVLDVGLNHLAAQAGKVRSLLAGLSEAQRGLWAELQGLVPLAEIEAGASAFEALVAKFESA